MPSSTKSMVGRGAVLGYSTASGAAPYTYTPLTKIVSISPSIEVGEVEDVTLDTVFDAYLPTTGSGECPFVLRHRPGDTGVLAIQGFLLAPQVVHWQVLAPDQSSITFDGFVKGYSVVFENKTIVDAEVPLRITTQPAFVPAP